MATATTTAATPQKSTNKPEQEYDYKATLARLSNEIETNLRKQFDAFFAQMEVKIDKLVQQTDDQEKVNINVLKQLDFLVENVTKLLHYIPAQANSTLPSPPRSAGHS